MTPDVQAKRDRTYALKRQSVKKLHAEAGDLERRAAMLAQTIAVTQAEQISVMIEAALLRKKAREES
jgi:hypothetical protein